MLERDIGYYIVGVGGIGMSAIARLLRNNGYRVSGSDNKGSKIVEALEALDVKVNIGQMESNINDEVDVLIRSTAIPDSNPEIVAAKKMGKVIMSRKEALSIILHGYETVAVTGSHGKTTVTSMLASIVNHTDEKANVLCGGIMDKYDSNCNTTDSKLMILEADESDGTFTHVGRNISVVTNIDREHLEYYGGFDNLLRSFKQFIIETTGKVVINLDDEYLQEIYHECKDDVEFVTCSCNNDDADYFIQDLVVEHDSSSFHVCCGSWKEYIKLSVPGKHNVSNALAAIACAKCLDISDDEIKGSLHVFRNAKRRFDIIGVVDNVTIIDDYAHCCTEIRSSIDAGFSVSKQTGGKLISIIQPHRYSRVKEAREEYKQLCQLSDITVMCPVFAAGEDELEGCTTKDIISGIEGDVYYVETEEALLELLHKVTCANDVLLFMGAGTISQYAYNIRDNISIKQNT